MERETKRVEGAELEGVTLESLEREAFKLNEIHAENERMMLFAIEMRACGEL